LGSPSKTAVLAEVSYMVTSRWKTLWLLAGTAFLAAGGDMAWKAKPINAWTPADASQILADSPWAKPTKAMISRLLTEDERREGGKMGQDHGVGYDGVDGNRAKPTLKETLLAGRAGADSRRTVHEIRLLIRWESALPIQAAEIKASLAPPPTLEGDGYRIAVFGIPGGYFKKDPKALGDPLKSDAVLRRRGKRDVKPTSVEVFQLEDGLAAVYLFPLSAELTSKDGYVEFVAQIGRVGIAERFDLLEMQLQGKLEL
jgi:hypothetical protein